MAGEAQPWFGATPRSCHPRHECWPAPSPSPQGEGKQTEQEKGV